MKKDMSSNNMYTLAPTLSNAIEKGKRRTESWALYSWGQANVGSIDHFPIESSEHARRTSFSFESPLAGTNVDVSPRNHWNACT